MLLEQFISNPDNMSSLLETLSRLNRLNFFGVMLDIASKRSAPSALAEGNIIDVSAQRAAWHDGYTEAIRDMYHFQERFTAQQLGVALKKDYGAADSLYIAGDISADEYERLTGTKPNQPTRRS